MEKLSCSKGSYQYELNILYPFSLVSSNSETGGINVLPGYWFLYNMFAMARNKSKFSARDKRFIKQQHIETDPFAPDTIQEVLFALDRILISTNLCSSVFLENFFAPFPKSTASSGVME